MIYPKIHLLWKDCDVLSSRIVYISCVFNVHFYSLPFCAISTRDRYYIFTYLIVFTVCPVWHYRIRPMCSHGTLLCPLSLFIARGLKMWGKVYASMPIITFHCKKAIREGIDPSLLDIMVIWHPQQFLYPNNEEDRILLDTTELTKIMVEIQTIADIYKTQPTLLVVG